MNNLQRRSLALLMLLGFCGMTLGDVFEECNETNDQQFVLSPKGCTFFILCNGEDSHEGECPEGDRFDATEQMCELMEDIDCRTGLPIGTVDPEENLVTENATTPGELDNAVTSETSTELPTLEVTDESSEASTTSVTAVAISPALTIVASVCPSIDNPNQIVLIAHDKSCTEYFICYRGQPISMSCAATLHFNVKTGKCDRAEIVKCMTSTISAREQCKRDTVDIYPHPDNCNYYYYCQNGFLLLQQCPFFYGWDYEKRSCVTINQAKCYGRRLRRERSILIRT